VECEFRVPATAFVVVIAKSASVASVALFDDSAMTGEIGFGN